MFRRLEIVPVDSQVGEHLRQQSLANFLLPVLDGCLAITCMERSVRTRTCRRHEANLQPCGPGPFADSRDELPAIHDTIVSGPLVTVKNNCAHF